MMKLSLGFLVVLVFSGVVNINAGPVRSSSELRDVLDEFIALIPKEKANAIFREYLDKDPEFQKAVGHVKSDEFKKLLTTVESTEELIDYWNYLDEAGLDIYDTIDELHKLLGLPPLVPGKPFTIVKITGGVAGLCKDIEAILRKDDIKALYSEKMKTSPAFAKFVKSLSSPKFYEIINRLGENKEFLKMLEFLEKSGIDINAINDLSVAIFGFQFPKQKYLPTPDSNVNAESVKSSSELRDVLDEFIALIPKEKANAIFREYLDKDPEFQKAVGHVKSDEFKKLLMTVESTKELIDYWNYADEAGLDIYDTIDKLHKLLGLPPLVPGKPFTIVKITGGVAGLCKDIEAILRKDDIKALYSEKMKTSPAFAKFVKSLSSPKFYEIINRLGENKELLKILEFLEKSGIDINAINDLSVAIFGFQFPKQPISRASKELLDDIEDFVDLLPLDKIIDIVVDYVYNDPEIQKAAAYVKSEEFKILLTKAQQNNEFRAYVSYLDESGLPAFEYVNAINRNLDIPEVGPPKIWKASLFSGNGFPGMLDAIETLLPRDAIKNMYQHKLKTSEAFVKFVQRLEAPEFQSIVEKLARNEDFQKFGYRVAEFGINLKEIVELLSKIFGIEMIN